MKKNITLSCLFLLIGQLGTQAFGQSSDPTATVAGFYKYDWSHSQIFNRRNLDARRRWLSPMLYKLFREELVKEQKLLAEHPTDKPYFGDGFPFQPLHEACTANGKSYTFLYSVGSAKFKGRKSLVDVRFFYPKQCSEDPTIFVLELVKVGNVWLIDDILYASGDRLSESMRNNTAVR